MRSGDLILVVNAGSSSLKFSVFAATADPANPDELAEGQVEGFGRAPRMTTKMRGATAERRDLPPPSVRNFDDAIPIAGEWLRQHFAPGSVAAVGHRIVHGGPKFSAPVLLDVTILAEIERLVPLAPLHQPNSIDCIRAITRWRDDIPQILCFDTAFHRTHNKLADIYALPLALYEAGIRRYGFHGTSYEYIASALPTVAPEIAAGRVIVAHLGNGASACAMRAGASVDSSMGFSALDGFVMGTRSGQLDPGVLLYLLGQCHMTASELEHLLYFESGLKGLSGGTSDMRALLSSSDPNAKLAIDAFVLRAAKEIAALAATLGGLDGLVFTAGIGENSPEIRARILESCRWLGVELDPEANGRGAARISTPASRVSAWIVPTHEDLMIARHTVGVIGGLGAPRRQA
jgi:acetate kinase